MPLLSAHDVHKTYWLKRTPVPVLRGASISVERGEWLAILGKSGSGKSTLLHLLGALDRPDRKAEGGGAGGEIVFDQRPLRTYSRRSINRYRNQTVGFAFQFFHLLPEMTVLENVAVAAMIRYGRFGYMARAGEVRRAATKLLDTFGLSHRLTHRPSELSGGERQRVAIARALINDPPLLLADEPTGNLDKKTGSAILDELARIRAESSLTVVMVTHDQEVAARADRIVRLEGGRVVGNGAGASTSAATP